jgi:hypothetical protein
MKATRNEALEELYIERLRQKTDHPREGATIHASDLDLCPIKTWYARILKPEDMPAYGKKDLLMFARGLALEAWLENEHERGERDGVLCSLDDKTLLGPTEIKTTAKSLRNFDPCKTYPHWMFRAKTYANVFNSEFMNLAVYFLVGNYRDIPTDLVCWRIDFTPEELDAHWVEVLRRKSILVDAITTGERIDLDEAWVTDWECEHCRFGGICYGLKQMRGE